MPLNVPDRADGHRVVGDGHTADIKVGKWLEMLVCEIPLARVCARPELCLAAFVAGCLILNFVLLCLLNARRHFEALY